MASRRWKRGVISQTDCHVFCIPSGILITCVISIFKAVKLTLSRTIKVLDNKKRNDLRFDQLHREPSGLIWTIRLKWELIFRLMCRCRFWQENTISSEISLSSRAETQWMIRTPGCTCFALRGVRYHNTIRFFYVLLFPRSHHTVCGILIKVLQMCWFMPHVALSAYIKYI